MENYKNIKEQLNEEGAAVTSNFQLLTLKLIKMVESGDISAFSFEKNEQNFGKTYTRINVDNNQVEPRIPLRLFEDLSEFTQMKKIKKDTYDKLSEINDYLYFINQFLNRDAPIIKEVTFYSLNNLNKTGGWATENYSLVPEFMQNKSMKAKI